MQVVHYTVSVVETGEMWDTLRRNETVDAERWGICSRYLILCYHYICKLLNIYKTMPPA